MSETLTLTIDYADAFRSANAIRLEAARHEQTAQKWAADPLPVFQRAAEGERELAAALRRIVRAIDNALYRPQPEGETACNEDDCGHECGWEGSPSLAQWVYSFEYNGMDCDDQPCPCEHHVVEHERAIAPALPRLIAPPFDVVIGR